MDSRALTQPGASQVGNGTGTSQWFKSLKYSGPVASKSNAKSDNMATGDDKVKTKVTEEVSPPEIRNLKDLDERIAEFDITHFNLDGQVHTFSPQDSIF